MLSGLVVVVQVIENDGFGVLREDSLSCIVNIVVLNVGSYIFNVEVALGVLAVVEQILSRSTAFWSFEELRGIALN